VSAESKEKSAAYQNVQGAVANTVTAVGRDSIDNVLTVRE